MERMNIVGEKTGERIVNPTKIKSRLENDGSVIFSRQCRDGSYYDVSTTKDDLEDAILSALWPLENFIGVLDKEDDDPGSLFFLLKNILEIANAEIIDILRAVENNIGSIDVYRCKGDGPIRRGEVLGITVKDETRI